MERLTRAAEASRTRMTEPAESTRAEGERHLGLPGFDLLRHLHGVDRIPCGAAARPVVGSRPMATGMTSRVTPLRDPEGQDLRLTASVMSPGGGNRRTTQNRDKDGIHMAEGSFTSRSTARNRYWALDFANVTKDGVRSFKCKGTEAPITRVVVSPSGRHGPAAG